GLLEQGSHLGPRLIGDELELRLRLPQQRPSLIDAGITAEALEDGQAHPDSYVARVRPLTVASSEEAGAAVVLRADDVVPEEGDFRQVLPLLQAHLRLPERLGQLELTQVRPQLPGGRNRRLGRLQPRVRITHEA